MPKIFVAVEDSVIKLCFYFNVDDFSENETLAIFILAHSYAKKVSKKKNQIGVEFTNAKTMVKFFMRLTELEIIHSDILL